MAFSALPGPLYVLYQQRDGFSTFLITVVFATYGVGVAFALFFLGHISDWVGRRRALAAALLVNVVSGLIFIALESLPALLVARAISGLSIGIVTATATAYITELHAAARPGASPRRADVVATLANLGGIGIGPLIGGILAQWAPNPLRLPFIVADGLLLIGLLGVLLAPETRAPLVPRPAYRPQRIAVPSHHLGTFFSAAGAIFVATAVLALFTSLAPSFLAGTLHRHSHALAGATAFTVFAAAALAQLALGRLSTRSVLTAGLLPLPLGLALITVAVWVPSLALFLLGGLACGAGAGLLFKGSLSAVIEIAPAATRAEALAGLFLASYIGLVLPAVGLGVATQYASGAACLTGFAAVTLLGILLSARPLLARHGEAAPVGR